MPDWSACLAFAPLTGSPGRIGRWRPPGDHPHAPPCIGIVALIRGTCCRSSTTPASPPIRDGARDGLVPRGPRTLSTAESCKRVLIVLLDLLARILSRAVAQYHALRRLANDLVEGGQRNRIADEPAALADELGPFPLPLPVGRGEQRRVLVDRGARDDLAALGGYGLRLGA